MLNLKAVALLVGGGTLLSIATGWLHAGQIIRTSSYLRSTAEAALSEGDHHRAFDLFEQYLVLNPDDKQIEEQISLLLEQHGTSTRALLRAFQINERLLLGDRSRDDLRLRQIRLAARLRRYSDAAVHLKTMRDKRTDLSEVWHYSGVVARDTGDFANALEYFSRAVSLKDPIPESFEYLARLMTTEAGDPQGAEQLLDRLVREAASAEAHRIRAGWLLDQSRPADAVPDLWAAIESEPHDPRTNAMILKAIRLGHAADHEFDADSQYQRMIVHLNQILSERPDEPALRLYLSSALWATGQRPAAINNLEYGIERDPRRFEIHEVLVDYLVSDEQYDRAQQIFDRIPERAVDRGRREFMRGRLLMAREQWDEAIAAFEMALGFASSDQSIASRAQVCLALCRRETGDRTATMDAYRSLIRSDPDFEGGRLGMASAYLRSGQTDLAIAEYRQLLHVDGVPEFLANLMIRTTLAQMSENRNWSEVEELLRNHDPIVTDTVQRTLLQVDLLFARGLPAQAMDHLVRAAQEMPDSPEMQRAVQRLSSIHGESLNRRVLRVLKEDPASREAHMSVLRLQVARQDSADMVSWLDQLAAGTVCPQLSERERLVLIANATTTVAAAEIETRGANEQTDILLRYAGRAWQQLAETSSRHRLNYIRYLARYSSVRDAIIESDAIPATVPAQIQAQCWLECLRQGAALPDVRTRVNQQLIKLVNADPSNTALRLAFAESRILLEHYDQAEQLLTQLAQYDRNNGLALGRLAWIATVIHADPQQALQYAEQAVRRTPTDPTVRSIRGLALCEADQTAAGLDVLTSIPSEERTPASHLFEARGLFLDGHTAEAAELVQDLRYHTADLVPAEVNMLRFLQQQLNIQPHRISSR